MQEEPPAHDLLTRSLHDCKSCNDSHIPHYRIAKLPDFQLRYFQQSKSIAILHFKAGCTCINIAGSSKYLSRQEHCKYAKSSSVVPV